MDRLSPGSWGAAMPRGKVCPMFRWEIAWLWDYHGSTLSPTSLPGRTPRRPTGNQVTPPAIRIAATIAGDTRLLGLKLTSARCAPEILAVVLELTRGATSTLNSPWGNESKAMSYRLTLERTPTHLHARVVGPNSPETVRRYITELREACQDQGMPNGLVEEYLEGPSLPMLEVFSIVQEASAAVWPMVRRIAFVDTNPAHDATPMQ